MDPHHNKRGAATQSGGSGHTNTGANSQIPVNSIGAASSRPTKLQRGSSKSSGAQFQDDKQLTFSQELADEVCWVESPSKFGRLQEEGTAVENCTGIGNGNATASTEAMEIFNMMQLPAFSTIQVPKLGASSSSSSSSSTYFDNSLQTFNELLMEQVMQPALVEKLSDADSDGYIAPSEMPTHSTRPRDEAVRGVEPSDSKRDLDSSAASRQASSLAEETAHSSEANLKDATMTRNQAPEAMGENEPEWSLDDILKMEELAQHHITARQPTQPEKSSVSGRSIPVGMPTRPIVSLAEPQQQSKQLLVPAMGAVDHKSKLLHLEASSHADVLATAASAAGLPYSLSRPVAGGYMMPSQRVADQQATSNATIITFSNSNHQHLSHHSVPSSNSTAIPPYPAVTNSEKQQHMQQISSNSSSRKVTSPDDADNLLFDDSLWDQAEQLYFSKPLPQQVMPTTNSQIVAPTRSISREYEHISQSQAASTIAPPILVRTSQPNSLVHSIPDMPLQQANARSQNPTRNWSLGGSQAASLLGGPAVQSLNTSDDFFVRPIEICYRFIAVDITDHKHLQIKIIHCFAPSDGHSKLGSSQDMTSQTVILKGAWYNTEIYGGDVFHIILLDQLGFEGNTRVDRTPSLLSLGDVIEIDNERNLLIMHPEVLVSPTKISEAISCARRGVLADRVKSIGSNRYPAVMGNLKHMFIELLIVGTFNRLSQCPNTLAIGELFSKSELDEIIRVCISKHLEDLYAVDLVDDVAARELSSMVQPTILWIKNLRNSGIDLGHAGQNHTTTGTSDSDRSKSICLVETIEGVEETLCSPVLGIKGQIDVICGCKITSAGIATPVLPHLTQAGGSNILLLHAKLPLELKTGKWRPSVVVSHSAQVMIYILMLHIRHRSLVERSMMAENIASSTPLMDTRDTAPRSGLLLYLSASADGSPPDCKLETITPRWTEIQGLILSRNRLAYFLKRSMYDASDVPLPPLLRSPRDCEYCFQASECMLYHAAIESGTEQKSGVGILYKHLVRSLTPVQLQYFKHWDRLIDLEAAALAAHQLQTWTISSFERERLGDKCIGGLITDYFSPEHLLGETKPSTDTSIIRFKKYHGGPLSGWTTQNNDVAQKTLNIGDRVTVSIELHQRGSHLSDEANQGNSVVDVEDSHLPQTTSISLCTSAVGESSSSVRGMKWSVGLVEPQIAMAQVSEVTEDHIEITMEQVPERLKRVIKSHSNRKRRGQFIGNGSLPLIRLDKEEASIGISTMRSNLVALFTETHNPQLFLSSKHLIDPASPQYLPQAPPGRSRLRELIINLRTPLYDITTGFPDGLGDLFLLRPYEMTPNTFLSSLRAYHRYLLNGNYSSAKELVPINTLLYRALYGPPHNGIPELIEMPLQVGKFGEINILGGLVIYPGCNPLEIYCEMQRLNLGQKDAVTKVLSAKDYTLLLGLPGTGKTTTMALIARALVARGEKVMISSYTHTAVDNLLLKLKDCFVRPEFTVRLGNASSVHPSVQEYIVSAYTSHGQQTKVIDLKEKMARCRLIACSMLAAPKHALLSGLMFDWCIIDEAGQISQPACIGALLSTHKFVLVGDDYQLPPLIISTEAQLRGMDVSLFKRLSEAHPESVCCLNIQYRMNDQIMLLSNALIYEHRMKCGLPQISAARFKLPNGLSSIPSIVHATTHLITSQRDDWLHVCLSSNQSVVFLNTDSTFLSTAVKESCSAESVMSRPGIHQAVSMLKEFANRNLGIIGNIIAQANSIEVKIVEILIWALIRCQYNLSEVGVITPYRAQVKAIQEALVNLSNSDQQAPKKLPGAVPVEVSTVDKFQGRDMEMIIFSTVRCANDASIGDLLRDWRRINVAITRSRTKLVIIGSLNILKRVPVLHELTTLIEDRKWAVNLNVSDLGLYSHN